MQLPSPHRPQRRLRARAQHRRSDRPRWTPLALALVLAASTTGAGVIVGATSGPGKGPLPPHSSQPPRTAMAAPSNHLRTTVDGIPTKVIGPAATSSSEVPLPGAAPPPPAASGAHVLGPAPASADVTLQVQYVPSHPARLAALATSVSDPASRAYHHFLDVAQLRRQFGATSTSVDQVDAYLRSFGLQVGGLSSDGLAQDVHGSAPAMAAALHTGLSTVRTASGSVVTGAVGTPRLPGADAAVVADIAGLHPWVTLHSNLATATPPATTAPTTTSGPGTTAPTTPPGTGTGTARADAAVPAPAEPTSCSALDDMAGAMSPSQLASTYGLTDFWSSSMLGQGRSIGVVEFAGFSTSDIDTFAQCIGVTPSVTLDPSTTTFGESSANLEPTADIETLLSLAPGASIVDFDAANGTGFAPVMNTVIAADDVQTLSISWTICDADMTQAGESSDNSLFAEAAAEGITVTAASGDDGAEGCGSAQSGTVSANYPASSPFVLGVGGTVLSGSTAQVWNDNGNTDGASGGGVDPYVAQPSWQSAPGTTANDTSQWCPNGALGCRQVPDVSALASGTYPTYCSASECGITDGWGLVGGTSLATPSWAAALALTGEECGTGLGLADPTLYELADSGEAPLGPVGPGTNAFGSGAPAGIFTSTGSGYSPVTGLGALGEGGPSLYQSQFCAASGGPVPASVPADDLSPSSLSLGPVGPGTAASATVTVTDTATAPLTVDSATVEAPGGPFATPGSCTTSTSTSGPVTLAPGASCTVGVSLEDSADGTFSGVLAIDDNAFGTVQSIALSGTVQGVGTLSTNATQLDLGSVQFGTNNHQSAITLTNTSATASVLNVAGTLQSTSNTLATPPTLDNSCASAIAPLASCTMAVVLNADQGAGSYSGSLLITASASNESSLSVPVAATVVAATLTGTVTPSTVSFGTVVDGSTGSETVTVTDTSSTTQLGIGSPSIAGTNASAFAIADDPCSGSVLQPGTTCPMTVDVVPAAVETLSATLSVPFGNGTDVAVPMTATGTSSSETDTTGSSGTGGSAGSTGGAPSTAGSPGGSSTSTSGSPGGGSGASGSGGGATASGSGSTSTKRPAGPAPATRIAGQTAVGTAIAVSEQLFPSPGSASAVVLARSDYYADALAGGPLARAVGGPLLITPGAPISTTLDPGVLAEIERVLAPGGTVYVLGGPLALAPGIDTQLQQAGFAVQRVYGQTEYGTAVAVANLLGNPSTVFEATGLDFSDALAAVPAAIAVHGAILLTEGSTQAPATAQYLDQHPSTVRYAIGGPLAAAGADPQATAVYGQNQFATAAAVAQQFFPTATTVGIATSATFSDALAGGVAMGMAGGPILLVPPGTTVPSSEAAYLHDQSGSIAAVTVFGGVLAVNPLLVNAVQAASQPPAASS